MIQDANYSMRMDKDLKAKLEKLARKEDRSLANYIQYVLKKHIQDCEKKKEQ